MLVHVNRRNRSAGFTLVELLITITILVIVTTIAVPSINRMVHKNRIIGVANEIVALGRFTQNEAIIRKERLILAIDKSDTHHWRIYVQPRDTRADTDEIPPSPNLVREAWLDERVDIVPDANSSRMAFNKIQFLPDGTVSGVTTASEKDVNVRQANSHRSSTLITVCSRSLYVSPRDEDTNALDVLFGGSQEGGGRKVAVAAAWRNAGEDCKKQP